MLACVACMHARTAYSAESVTISVVDPHVRTKCVRRSCVNVPDGCCQPRVTIFYATYMAPHSACLCKVVQEQHCTDTLAWAMHASHAVCRMPGCWSRPVRALHACLHALHACMHAQPILQNLSQYRSLIPMYAPSVQEDHVSMCPMDAANHA